jgi:hypothetical protein
MSKKVTCFKEILMVKKVILLSVVIVLGIAGFAQALEGELHGKADVTYWSKFIWRGFAVFGPHGSFQPRVDLDLYQTGFGVDVIGRLPISSGYVNVTRWDFNLYYGNKAFEDESYEMDYRLAWVYYLYPDQPRRGTAAPPASNQAAAKQELNAVLSFPKILGVTGLVPSYAPIKVWPSESGSFNGANSTLGGTASAWGHVFMLDYTMPVQGLMPETPEQPLMFHAELVYNDGFHPLGAQVDHDWSHLLVGAITEFDLGYNMYFTPALWYQFSFESSVNPDDELYTTLGLTYKF